MSRNIFGAGEENEQIQKSQWVKFLLNISQLLSFSKPQNHLPATLPVLNSAPNFSQKLFHAHHLRRELFRAWPWLPRDIMGWLQGFR